MAVPSPRGSSVHVVELAKSLTELGHEVHVVCRRVHRADPATEVVDGITLHRVFRWIIRPESKSSFTAGPTRIPNSRPLNSFYYLYLLTIFRFYVAIVVSRLVFKFDLNMIFERETSFGAGGLASLFTRRPMVLEIIGPRYSRLSAWRSGHILYYTDTMLRSWVDRRKCVPVPAGVNLSLFCADGKRGIAVRNSLKLGEEDFVVGYIGTFQTWHGMDDLLNAMISLKSSHSSLRALLVGPGFEEVLKKAKELGISEICRFTGAVDYNAVPDFINACDIMVAPYKPEADPLRKRFGIGWPLKILEYMACGKPVISTMVSPIDQIISDKRYGTLIEPGNVQEFANAIEQLILNPTMRQEMGKLGSELVRSKYSWGAVAELVSKYVDSPSG